MEWTLIVLLTSMTSFLLTTETKHILTKTYASEKECVEAGKKFEKKRFNYTCTGTKIP